MADPNTKRVRLTRSIILNHEHAEKGEIHDAPTPFAHRLVGEGSAEFVNAEEKPTTVNRMVVPNNNDPKTSKVSDAPAPKVKNGGKPPSSAPPAVSTDQTGGAAGSGAPAQ